MYLSKHMMIAFDTVLPPSVMTPSSTFLSHSLMRTIESENPTAFCDVQTASCQAAKVTIHGKARPAEDTTEDNPHVLVLIANHKTTVD